MNPFEFGFSVMPILFMLIWILAAAMMVFSLIRSLKEWNKNNHSPRLTVEATVVEKRMQVRRRNTGNRRHMNYRAYTDYYATFQFESGDRLELELPETEAGLIVEGDRGKVTFQGTRFLGFQRL